MRLYTTPAFVAINEPFRNPEEGVEQPLPVLVTILAEALRKLRQIGADDMAAVSEMFLWRGMKNLKPSDEFKTRGGTELGTHVDDDRHPFSPQAGHKLWRSTV